MTDLLKEGSKHLVGLYEAILRNLEAVKKLSQITRTSLGPNGMNKIVINHLEKLFITSDAGTIIRELEVVHPAAKMVVLAAQQQEQEVGDGTNLVVVLSGEFLLQAESLLRMGLHPSQVIEGFSKAGKKVLEMLDSLVCYTVQDIHNEAEVTKALNSVIASKQYGLQDILTPLIARACIMVLPQKPELFNVDHVRVCKVAGGGVPDSRVVKGFAIARDTEGMIKRVASAHLAVYQGGVDYARPETKGTVLIHSAEELLSYSKGEEQELEQLIASIAEAGVKVVVSGSTIGEMAMHFMERYKLMVIKCPSKFELKRICQTTGAEPLVNLVAPTPTQRGYCDEVRVEEMASTKVIVFCQSQQDTAISTIVVRGATQNILDDIERAIDDGVNVFKQMAKEGTFVAGAGASEMRLASLLASFGEAQPGLDQYAVKKYAEAFEIVPRTLAENAGMAATDVLSNLYAAHESGKTTFGVDIENASLYDALAAGVIDSLRVKRQAIELATAAAISILSIDQIIMAKPAGGPKPPQQSAGMDPDD